MRLNNSFGCFLFFYGVLADGGQGLVFDVWLRVVKVVVVAVLVQLICRRPLLLLLPIPAHSLNSHAVPVKRLILLRQEIIFP